MSRVENENRIRPYRVRSCREITIAPRAGHPVRAPHNVAGVARALRRERGAGGPRSGGGGVVDGPRSTSRGRRRGDGVAADRRDGLRGRGAAELRQLERAAAVVAEGGRARAAAAGPLPVVLVVLVVARRREARVPVRLADAERAHEPLAGPPRGPGQQQVQHGPLPAEYEEHEHAAQRVDRVRRVPVVRGRVVRQPRYHLEHERHAHQAEQLQVQRQPAQTSRTTSRLRDVAGPADRGPVSRAIFTPLPPGKNSVLILEVGGGGEIIK